MNKKKINFREVCDTTVLIIDKQAVQSVQSLFESNPGDNALLAYGYIDHEAGLTFEVLCVANLQAHNYDLRKGNDEISFKLRSGSIQGEVIPLQNKHYLDFYPKIKVIKKSYQCSDAIKYSREVVELDAYRHQDYIDDLSVYFIKSRQEYEVIWCRIVGMSDHSFFGTLLNEPHQDFNYHINDLVEITIYPIDHQYVPIAILK